MRFATLLSDPSRSGLSTTISVLTGRLAAHDPDTGSHSKRVARLALRAGRQLELPPTRLAALARAALVHDVGKLTIDPRLLQKPGPLTPDEYGLVQGHAVAGERLLRGLGMDAEATVVRHHHERIDGAGYPDGIAGTAIPLESRIILVADAFEAITADRPYRQHRTVDEAIAELRRASGTQFDARCVAALERAIGHRGLLAA